MIFAIGDSHSIFYHKSSIIKEHWLGFRNLPVTMYQFIHTHLNIWEIGTLLGNGHEKFNIQEGDTVLFSFGWNDVQKNIKTHATNYKEEIHNLVNGYINKLKSLPVIPIINCIYPNPHVVNQNTRGSDAERLTYIHEFNKILKKKSQENGILFFDIYDFIVRDGYIKKEYTSDYIHLDYNNQFLQQTIESKLLDIIGKYH